MSPGKWEDYLTYKGEYLSFFQSKVENNCELVASWKFIYGDVNFRALHVFRYPNVSNDESKFYYTLQYLIAAYSCVLNSSPWALIVFEKKSSPLCRLINDLCVFKKPSQPPVSSY